MPAPELIGSGTVVAAKNQVLRQLFPHLALTTEDQGGPGRGRWVFELYELLNESVSLAALLSQGWKYTEIQQNYKRNTSFPSSSHVPGGEIIAS